MPGRLGHRVNDLPSSGPRRIVTPPLNAIATEYRRRFVHMDPDFLCVAERKGWTTEVAHALLTAIESGEPVDTTTWCTRMAAEPAKPGTVRAWLEQRGPITDEMREATRRKAVERVRKATPQERTEFTARNARARLANVGRLAHRATRDIVNGRPD